MTEFRKLSDQVTSLESLLPSLASLVASSSFGSVGEAADRAAIQEAHRVLTEAHEIIGAAAPRMEKFVMRAREKDPEKQIYNEAMCQKVELLAKRFDDVAPQFEPHEPTVSDAYEGLVEWEASAGEIARRVVTQLSDLLEVEEKSRLLIHVEQRRMRNEWEESARAELHAILEAHRLAEEARWTKELQRRAQEQRSLLAAAADGARGVADAIQVMREREEDDLGYRYAAISKALRSLLREVMSRPEEPGIRTLRCNHPSFVKDFGHPCFAVVGPEQQGLPEGEPSAVLFYPYVERILAAIGYRVQYVAESVRGPRPAPPTGHGRAHGIYRPLGFEDYAERVLGLQEPDASAEPEQWMQWFAMLESTEACLRKSG